MSQKKKGKKLLKFYARGKGVKIMEKRVDYKKKLQEVKAKYNDHFKKGAKIMRDLEEYKVAYQELRLQMLSVVNCYWGYKPEELLRKPIITPRKVHELIGGLMYLGYLSLSPKALLESLADRDKYKTKLHPSESIVLDILTNTFTQYKAAQYSGRSISTINSAVKEHSKTGINITKADKETRIANINFKSMMSGLDLNRLEC